MLKQSTSNIARIKISLNHAKFQKKEGFGNSYQNLHLEEQSFFNLLQSVFIPETREEETETQLG